MKTWLITVLGGVLIASLVVAEDEPPAADPTHQWILKVEPRYPREARVNMIEGYVRVSFTVTEHGEPADITIVESQPPGMFEAEAVNAFRRWRFEPARVEGEYIETRGEEVIQFKLSAMRPVGGG